MIQVRPKAMKVSRSIAGMKIINNWDLYLLILPAVILTIVFNYLPMYGVQIAFKKFMITKGIWGSPWVGFEHFIRFFKSYNFWILIENTLGLSLYQLAVGFPAPIILALMLNEVKNAKFKKVVQTVTYAPNFLSVVVFTGMIIAFLSPQSGIVNQMIKIFGGDPIFFMTKPEWFKTIYVLSDVWQKTGWNSIIYIAALTAIDPQLYEASHIEGAGKLQRLWHITLPGIMPTAITLLILNTGQMMNVGFEKVFLLQNSLNMEASDVISTYVYRIGLVGAEFSFSSAVGLFNSVINCFFLVLVNYIARKTSETSIW